VLYARLEDEYELKERLDALNRKLAVVAETANTLADIIDTRRSLRLELVIVALIAFEMSSRSIKFTLPRAIDLDQGQRRPDP